MTSSIYFHLNLTSNSNPNQWGSYDNLDGAGGNTTVAGDRYPSDISGNGYVGAYISDGDRETSKFGFAPIPATPNFSIKRVKVRYSSIDNALMDDPSVSEAAGIEFAKLTLNGNSQGTADPIATLNDPLVTAERYGDTWWHYFEFTDLNIDISSGTTNNFIELRAGDHAGFDADWDVKTLYIEVEAEPNLHYREIRIDGNKSNSTALFSKDEGETFEVELYHNDTTNTIVPIGTTIDFEIAASPNDAILGNGGFTLDDIASVTVGSTTYTVVEGVLSGQTSVIDQFKTDKIVITLATGVLLESTEYFRLTFADTDSLGRTTTLSGSQESWNSSNIAQTYDMLIENVGYTEIKIDGIKSDSIVDGQPAVFSKNEGQSFEVELYHNGIEIGTEIDFTIAASPGDTFTSDDIASVTVDGNPATKTYVADTEKTQKIVITLAEDVSTESTEKFRLTFATTDSAGNSTTLTSTQESWNSTNLAQTYDMLIADVPPPVVLPDVSVTATQNGTKNSVETGTPVVFTFTRTDTTDPLDVNYRMFGTAVAGTDYDYIGTGTGTVSFEAGQGSVDLSLTPMPDSSINPVKIVGVYIDKLSTYDITPAKQFAEATIVGDGIVSSEIRDVKSSLINFRSGHAQANYVRGGLKIDGSIGGYSSAPDTNGITQIFSNWLAYAGLKQDGSVVTWGDQTDGGDSSSYSSFLSSNITAIYSTAETFAALKVDNNNYSVVAWGRENYGVTGEINLNPGVDKIVSNYGAYAALLTNGTVVTWGRSDHGGDGTVDGAGPNVLEGVTNVIDIFSTRHAFAALLDDGSVVVWGDSSWGGDSSGVDFYVHEADDFLVPGVVKIFASINAFAALKSDGSVVVWGNSIGGGTNNTGVDLTSGVTWVFSNVYAFAALKEDGSVVTWGSENRGGNSSSVQSNLTNVVQIYSTDYSFAALKSDGSVVTWGEDVSDGVEVSSNVKRVYATKSAFAALKTNGTVVTWGSDYGDNSSGVDLTDIVRVFAFRYGFVALKDDGSTVNWGFANPIPIVNDVRTFPNIETLDVLDPNIPPFLNDIEDQTVVNDGEKVVINLSGITDGGDDTTPLQITAESSDTSLISNIDVVYTSGEIGSLEFTPNEDQFGETTITVTIEDAGNDNRLDTTTDNLTYSTTFVLNVIEPAPDAVSVVATQNGTTDGTKVIFTFERTGNTNDTLDVNYHLFGTAIAGTDYEPPAGTIRFEAGVNSVDLELTPMPDSIIDPVKIVGVYIKKLSNYDITPSKHFAEATITGDGIESSEINPFGSKGLLRLPANGYQQSNLYFAALTSEGSLVWTGASISLPEDNSNFKRIFASYNGFAAIKTDGSVFGWGVSLANAINDMDGNENVERIYTTSEAFAALKTDGSVITWGNSSIGGDSTGVDFTGGVTKIASNYGAFAALKNDGSVVVWGGDGAISSIDYGGGGTSELDGITDVIDIFTTRSAFVALRGNGQVIAWGWDVYGGDSSGVDFNVDGTPGVVKIFSTQYAFAALKEDGSVVIWGSSSNGGTNNTGVDLSSGVTWVFSNAYSFAALKQDGSVVTWGNSTYGGDSTGVDLTNVVEIFSTYTAFAALKQDGTVVTWGNSDYGGNSSGVDFSGGIKRIYSTVYAFAALKNDGSVVVWGDVNRGGSNNTGVDLSKDIVRIFPRSRAFVALKKDGSVVSWGESPTGAFSETNIRTLANAETLDVLTPPLYPTLDNIDDIELSVNVDGDPLVTIVDLFNITDGADGSRPLRVTATSSNTDLIDNVIVAYTSPEDSGELRFTPVNQYGRTTITVEVESGGLDKNLSTEGDNLKVTRTFDVIVQVPPPYTKIEIDEIKSDDDQEFKKSEGDSFEVVLYHNGIVPEGTTIDFSIVAYGEFNANTDISSVTVDGNPATQTSVVGDKTKTIVITLADDVNTEDIEKFRLQFAATDSNGFSTTLTDSQGTWNPNNLAQTYDMLIDANDNLPPTLDIILPQVVAQNSGTTTITLTGITDGDGASTPLQVTATSNNIGLIEDPTVTYNSPSNEAELSFTPRGQYGEADITVTVTDKFGLSFSRTFTIYVNVEQNLPPTLVVNRPRYGIDNWDVELGDDGLLVLPDSGETELRLTEISDGDGQDQPLRITAISNRPDIIPDPTIQYPTNTSSTQGFLRFTPTGDLGDVLIAVIVEDAGIDEDFTTVGNGVFIREFPVRVANSSNLPPTLDQPQSVSVIAGSSPTITLTGITDGDNGDNGGLEVEAVIDSYSASSGGTPPMTDLTVSYTFPDKEAYFSFNTSEEIIGTATLRVTVLDNGFNGQFRESVSKTLVVSVRPKPSIVSVVQHSNGDEDGTPVQFLFTRTDEIDKQLYVNYSLFGTAKEDVNYKDLQNGTITFEPGQSSYTLQLPTINDGIFSPVETLRIRIDHSSTAGYKIHPNKQFAEATITSETIQSSQINKDFNQVVYDPSVRYQQNVYAHAALLDDGKVIVWGAPSYGGRQSDVDDLEDIVEIFSNYFSFAALTSQGIVHAWGISSQGGSIPAGLNDQPTVRIFSTRDAYVALRVDGSIVTWGAEDWGGSIPSVVQEQLTNKKVVDIVSGERGFVALTEDGQCVNWGDSDSSYGFDNTLRTGISKIFPGHRSFAAITTTGGVVAWGQYTSGFSNLELAANETIVDIVSNRYATTVLKNTGEVFSWGISSYGGVAPSDLTEVSQVYPLQYGFAALKFDGSIVTWGRTGTYGVGIPTSVQAVLADKKVIEILGGNQATAALTEDGTVVAWGDARYGGSTPVGNSDVIKLYQTYRAFAALKSNGDVIAWGEDDYGGSIPSSVNANKIKRIFPNARSFAALRVDGSTKEIIHWGFYDHYFYTNSSSAGYISSENRERLNLGVVTLVNGETYDSISPLINLPPSFNPIADQEIIENSPEQSITITGITDGDGLSRPLRVSAEVISSSNNSTLVYNLNVDYVPGPDSTEATLRYTPALNQFGTARIRVTLEDAGTDQNLDTTINNAQFRQEFDIVVTPIPRLPPYFDEIQNITINEDSSTVAVNVTGMTDRDAADIQPLRLTATSSNTDLIPDPYIVYISDDPNGNLLIRPVANKSGTCTITVKLEDGGRDENLATTDDNQSFERTFDVTVTEIDDPPTIDPIADQQVDKRLPGEDEDDEITYEIPITGLSAGAGESGTLELNVVSDQPDKFEQLTSRITGSTGKITFILNEDENGDTVGTANITVTVSVVGDGDQLLTTSESFSIEIADINSPPTLDPIDDISIEQGSFKDVNLTGITAGFNDSQDLQVTVTSSDSILLPNDQIFVYYTSPSTIGSIRLVPRSNRFGKVDVTVRVTDAGLDNNLGTSSDNLSVTQKFEVTVNQVVDPEYWVLDLELVSHPGNQSIVLNNGYSAEVCHITEYSKPLAEYVRGFGHTLDNPLVASGDASIKSRLTGVLVASGDFLSSGAIPNSGLFVTHGPSKHIDGSGSLQATYTDKLAGDFGDYRCAEKLYPIADISNSYFVTSSGTHSDLYSSIDEGVFSGDGIKENGVSTLIADSTTFIQPSSIHTDDTFSYKCKVTTPLLRPEHTRLRIRAAAPLFTHEAKIPPKYTFTDIKFEDPDGALIVQYNDISLYGDSAYISMSGDDNFATYSSAPKINNITYSWDDTYPNLSGTEYTLSFTLLSEDPGDAFTAGFDTGFEEDYDVPDPLHSGDDYLALDGSPLSSISQSYINPTPSIRISAIEICNSGGRGPRTEDYISLFAEVRPTGDKIQRTLIPTSMPLVDFDTTIYPTVSSVWYASNDSNFSNYNTVGTKRLIHNINSSFDSDFIIMNHTSGVADSGKLTLKMGHNSDPNTLKTQRRGAFDLGFDGLIGGTCIRNGAFNRLTIEDDNINDGFFVVDRDCITLRVRAKKQSGSRDYVLDVVGYSDDCILNITSAAGGFLQASSGNPVGNYPVSSGFSGSDDLALSATSLSQRENYFQVSGDNSHFVNLGEDHYSLVDGPLVNTTDFAWYEIPLKVYDDNVTLGRSRDYRMSSLLENLYLDIYPLPSGASISQVEMLVTYSPQNALQMITAGGEVRRVTAEGRTEPKIFPSSMQPNDSYLNAGSGYGSLSYISGIPQAYSTKNTSLKTNYSRRWRGMEGLTEGPYDQEAFGFSFYNPQLDYPFLSGFYDFDKENGVSVIPRVGNLTGVISSTYSTYRFKNLGWRFKDSTLFADQLPGYTGAYETIDWSSLSNGSDNFHNHPLSGQIADAFNTAVRISGHNSNINFGDINIVPDSGFSMYVRFSPDANVSGVGYDLFESGCLFSKWDTGNDLEFALGYASGFLRGYARDDLGAIHTIQDPAICSGYQYPLSVILTYNDDGRSGLKLYTDNEFEPNWQTMRASSVAPFKLHTADSNFIVGNSTGSGVGFNMFLTELGISNSGNVVYSNPDPTYKQVTAQKFLENNRSFWWDNTDTSSNDGYTLWQNIDEDTRTDWDLGEFKYQPFSLAFKQYTKRTNRDLVSFKVFSDGQPYYAKTDQTLPSTIDSGVAYHSQIENDFLRFHLSDTPDNFYSVHPRINKSLPRGYNFIDDALVVETVFEHTTDNEIVWSGGQIGPKLIVSLYTKNQEPYYETVNPNWGLINRSTHYLEPSGGISRIDSKFTYGDVCDTSEAWANFPIEATLKELKDKYYSQDVDDMFLQYDVVYPSGGSFESKIDIHTAHVRMEKAYVNPIDDSGILKIATSGGYVVDDRDLMLSLYNGPSPVSGEMHLYAIGPVDIENSGLSFYTSGALVSRESLDLFTHNFGTIQESGLSLYSSGKLPTDESDFVRLNTLGKGILTSEGVDRTVNSTGITIGTDSSTIVFNNENNTIQLEGLNLQDDYDYRVGGTITITNSANPENNGTYTITGISSTSGTNDTLTIVNTDGSDPDLVTGSDSTEGLTVSGTYTDRIIGMALTAVNTVTAGYMSGILNLNTFVSPSLDKDAIQVNMPIFMLNDIQRDRTNSSNVLNLQTLATSALVSVYSQASMNLFVQTGYATNAENMNLTLYGDNFSTTASSGSMNLTTVNYGGVGSDYLYWFNNNVGTGIDVFDNNYATLPADDELRGVDLIGYGSCTGNSPDKATDAALITDDVVWREEQCVEGGIMRADKTYTNFEAGYSGNYYGIRKYTELIPNNAYLATLEMKTGSTDPIKVPRDLEEWEYGINSDINYSGVKLIGDDPALSGDASIEYPLPESGRNPYDNYGKAVAVHKDLMVVGSPFIDIPDESGHKINNAGAAFVYRRNEDVPGQKADWQLATHLVLPSGFKRDFVSREISNIITYDSFSIDGNKWNVGQEGRELGHSVAIASSGDTETIVVGAPGAGWSRTFDTITESGIPVCMMVFTDQYNYEDADIARIGNTSETNRILYRYFSAPWLEGFQPRIDIQLLVFQVAYNRDAKPKVNSNIEWFNHRYIQREDDQDLLSQYSKEHIRNEMFSGIKESFEEVFRHNTVSPHSGIPPIVGIFKDSTLSTKFTNSFQSSVDKFVNYYNAYSFASGVNDPSDASQQIGYINQTEGASENFVVSTIDLLNDTLATGNLNSDNALRFITSGVGQEWANPNAYQFQIPPASGGRVYIFEKENNEFNLVQEIKAKTEREFTTTFNNSGPGDYVVNLGSIPSTRFGHSVSISDENEILTVGSPYDVNAVEVFERNPSEHNRMLDNLRNWLDHRNMSDEIDRFNELYPTSGLRETAQQVYYEFSASDKFLFRIDESFWNNNPIELYKNIYTFGYNNIPYRGTWSFIPDEFAGTSRLGYSTAVSSSGKTIAVGAPTDSFNEFDDDNIWYGGPNGYKSYASYTNAGAVRVFESRNYYPHSGVVEFYKFGNLDRTMHPSVVDKGFYDQWDIYYGDDHPFTRTAFSDIEIPEDAGLAFIITPEVDAASDEIIQNIKDWLALGDRTLVLVGNDPTWEDNGLYKKSNDIINKILQKLDSRMRIHPARNEHEALVGARNEIDVVNKKYNVVASKVPSYATSTLINNGGIFASGVGDIRINVSGDLGPNFITYEPCNDKNAGCGLPLMNNGDLRAEWNDVCTKTIPGVGVVEIPYKVNWPFQFGNPNPSDECDEPPQGAINRPYQDIRPILAAAEDVPERTYTIPAVPETSGLRVERVQVGTREVNETFDISFFEEQQLDEVAFSLSGLPNEDGNSIATGTNMSNFTRGSNLPFDDPEPVTASDGSIRDGLLYATGINALTPDISQVVRLADESIAITKEQYFDDENNSTIHSVYLMANMTLESAVALGKGGADQPAGGTPNSDQNIAFYNNLIMKDCFNIGKVYQLGGWTGHSSFTSAYSKSTITQVWEEYEQSFQENVIFGSNTEAGEIQEIPDDVNVLWIANPQGLPTEADLNVIKNWLHADPENLGDTDNPDLVEKKIVITFGTNPSIASNVTSICESLNLTTQPRRSANNLDDPFFQGFFLKTAHGLDGTIYQFQNVGEDISTNGCPEGYVFADLAGFSNEVNEGLYIPLPRSETIVDSTNFVTTTFLSIELGDNTTKILSFDGPVDIIEETRPISQPDSWYVPGDNASATFNLLPGSGYRIFINKVSENINEKLPIDYGIQDVSFPPNDAGWNRDKQTRNPSDYYVVNGLAATTTNSVDTLELDLYVLPNDRAAINIGGIDHVPVKINFQMNRSTTGSENLPGGRPGGGFIRPRTSLHDFLSANNTFPASTRLLSISGCPLPIRDTQFTVTEEIPIYEDRYYWEIIPAIPEQVVTIPATFRTIMNDNTQYCDPNSNDPTGAGNTDRDQEIFNTLDGESDKECLGGVEIQDGPIVCAVEQETFTGFVNGFKRSTIVLISDSTIVQGQNAYYRNDFNAGNQRFMRSLYPFSPGRADDDGNFFNRGRNYSQVQKLLAPERGSPGKYRALSGGTINTALRFGGASFTAAGTSLFTDTENNINPNDVARFATPTGEEKLKIETETFEDTIVSNYGVFPRFSGIIDGVHYMDAGRGGGMPDLLKKTGKDYLDLDVYSTGYPGDLFGYDVSVYNDKLLVGAPFNAFASGYPSLSWTSAVNYYNDGINPAKMTSQGGVGAAFYFERTEKASNAVSSFLPWEYKDKIQAGCLSLGFDNPTMANLSDHKGDHSLDGPFVTAHAHRNDEFGRSVAIASDMLAVGAPCHDFETLHDHIFESDTAFIRKDFNAEFKIHKHISTDLGCSGIRVDDLGNDGTPPDSGTMVLNNGAVFTFKQRITDWANRIKTWEEADKINAQGYSDRNTALSASSGTENDHFGTSVALHRAKRGDSDYTLVVGSPNHNYSTSGNHITSENMENAGAAYTFDAMLREQLPTIPNSNSYMIARVFGDREVDHLNTLTLNVNQNTTGDPIKYTTSGIIWSNSKGHIFVEASGYDASSKGFAIQRPYVVSVRGNLLPGTPDSDNIGLFTAGKPFGVSGNMNLMLSGAPSANVYNNMTLYNRGVLGLDSGNLQMFLEAPSGSTSNLTVFISGKQLIEQQDQFKLYLENEAIIENLNLRVRGK